MRRILTLTLPLLCGTLSLAQTEQSEPGTLTTSVFLIDKSGDLKPARLAKVKAFYLRKQDAKENTMGQITADAIEALHTIYTKTPPSRKREMCLTEVEDLVHEAEVSAKTMADTKYASQVVTFTLDEEGKGSAKVSLPGMYVIAAFGNAGINAGFWFEFGRIEAGKETLLKMSSPLVACVREE
jgi:hypothetical protein